MSGVAQAISPAVASDDSWNPASPIRAGSLSSRSVAAQPSAAVARPGTARSRARAGRPPAMSAARTTEADAPANATYATIASDRHDRPPPATEPPGHRADRGRDDRDVPAGDRDDVAHAGGRERGREVAVDAVAEPDQDPGREPGLGLGQDAGQRVAGAPPERLETATRVVGCRLDGRAFGTSASRRRRSAPR